MPIDSRIALGVDPVKVPTVMDLRAQTAQVRNLEAQAPLNQQQAQINAQRLRGGEMDLLAAEQKMAADKRKEDGLRLFSRLAAEKGQDHKAIVQGLNERGYADLAMEYTADQAKIRKDALDGDFKQVEIALKRNERLAQVLGSGIDSKEKLNRAGGMLIAEGYPVEQILPFLQKEWNEQTKAELEQIGLQSETNRAAAKAILDQRKAERDAEEAKAKLPGIVAESEYSQMKVKGETPEQKLAADKFKVDKWNSEQSARHAKNMEAIAIRGQNLTDARARELNQINRDNKPPTAFESEALGFYRRAAKALDVTSQLEADIQKMGLWEQGKFKFLPNVAQSETNQRYTAAQKQFTEARLRQDSGAAIPIHEYVNDAAMYFVQPGDTKQTILDKEAARKEILESLRFASGRAYSQYTGEPLPTAANAPKGNSGRMPKVGDMHNGERITSVRQVK